MIEWLLVPAIMGMAALYPKSNDDRAKIHSIFQATNYGVPDKEKKKLITPKFKKKMPILDGKEEIGIRYLYTIPLGLRATQLAETEKSISLFSDGLNRPVIVEFRKVEKHDPKKYLTFSVFNKELPNMYPYSKVPEQTSNDWLIPLGRTLEQTIWHDFDKIPHMTVSGTTRFGKTVFLKMLMTWLIEHHKDDVEFYIIDLKGGLEFGRYEKLKQVKRIACDPIEAFIVLKELFEELNNQFQYFKGKNYTNILNTPIKKRTFIIVDEAAQLAPDKWMNKKEKELLGACQSLLSDITNRGGGVGFREIYCTQYPTADTLPRNIKQNSDGKVTFRLPSGYASDVAIDEHGAEKLPSDVKGRALYKTHEIKEMQVPYISDDEMWGRLHVFIESGKEEETAGGNFVEFVSDEVRNKRTAPKNAQPGNGSKRNRRTKPNEGLPAQEELRREKRVLPKRKGKGVSRSNDRGEMDPSSGTPPTTE